MMKVNKVEKGKIWNDKKEEEEGGKNLGADAATSIVHPVALSCHTNSDGYTSAAYLGRICHLENSAFYWHHLLLLDLFHHLVPYLVPPLSHYATNSFLALTPLFVIGWLRRSSRLPATYSNDCVYNSSSSVQPSGVARKKQIAPGCNSPEIWLCCRAFYFDSFHTTATATMKGEEEEEEEEGASCYCPSDHLFSAGLDIQPKVLIQPGITQREREKSSWQQEK